MDDLQIARAAGYPRTAYNGKPLPSNWPEPLDAGAFQGVAGEAVRAMSPHTEADTAALLVQFLTGVGNMFPRGPYWQAGADRHYSNLFAVIVGESSTGRKGSSWNMIGDLLRAVDPEWRENHVQTGLSSGEGLIWQVRDRVVQRVPDKKTGNSVEVEMDPGVTDKRLLTMEPEFASVLRSATRQGNTVSTWLRQAWDGSNLGTMTKSTPIKATTPHISVVGHISAVELRAELTRTDTANGFANRFLWCASMRSKSLPDGGEWYSVDQTPLVKKIHAGAEFAGYPRIFKRNAESAAAWRGSLYDALTDDRGGLFGAATSRAEAQVMRLAMIYAVLDRSSEVALEHLNAAVQVWRYCEDRARWLFGDASGNPVADTIRAQLVEAGTEGLSRTDIRNLFGKHGDAEQIQVALNELVSAGVAMQTRRETAGRYAEVWQALKTTQETPETRSRYKLPSPSVASVASVAAHQNGGAA